MYRMYSSEVKRNGARQMIEEGIVQTSDTSSTRDRFVVNSQSDRKVCSRVETQSKGEHEQFSEREV